jgi:2-methylaconitate cis-trans-isomerase PrpF
MMDLIVYAVHNTGDVSFAPSDVFVGSNKLCVDIGGYRHVVTFDHTTGTILFKLGDSDNLYRVDCKSNCNGSTTAYVTLGERVF